MEETKSNKLQTYLLAIIIIASLSGIVYYNKDHYKNAYENILVYVGINGPCKHPLEYSVGTFDTRFGITKEQFLNITLQASNLWSSAVNKELFKYTEGGELKVNLIYDNRQKATNDMQTIGSVIDNSKGSYNIVRAQYQSLQFEYNQTKIKLATMTTAFNSDKIAYESLVSNWNSRGGAPKDQYVVLEQQRQALNNQADILNTESRSFNVLVDKLNTTANQLNSLATNINQKVSTYNTIGASTGLEFEEGQYVSDNVGEHIDIYQYTDYDKLFRVLSHEFGHALGLDHVDDPNAIMYMLNMDSSKTLAPADIAALKDVCSIK